MKQCASLAEYSRFVARKMLESGMDTGQIAAFTGLTEAEIQAL